MAFRTSTRRMTAGGGRAEFGLGLGGGPDNGNGNGMGRFRTSEPPRPRTRTTPAITLTMTPSPDSSPAPHSTPMRRDTQRQSRQQGMSPMIMDPHVCHQMLVSNTQVVAYQSRASKLIQEALKEFESLQALGHTRYIEPWETTAVSETMMVKRMHDATRVRRLHYRVLAQFPGPYQQYLELLCTETTEECREAQRVLLPYVEDAMVVANCQLPTPESPYYCLGIRLVTCHPRPWGKSYSSFVELVTEVEDSRGETLGVRVAFPIDVPGLEMAMAAKKLKRFDHTVVQFFQPSTEDSMPCTRSFAAYLIDHAITPPTSFDRRLLEVSQDLGNYASARKLARSGIRPPSEWVPSATRSRCYICRTPFGFFRARHHCRHCGEVICRECIVKREVPQFTTNGARIGMIRTKFCVLCVKRMRDDRTSAAVPPMTLPHRAISAVPMAAPPLQPRRSSSEDDIAEMLASGSRSRARRRSQTYNAPTNMQRTVSASNALPLPLPRQQRTSQPALWTSSPTANANANQGMAATMPVRRTPAFETRNLVRNEIPSDEEDDDGEDDEDDLLEFDANITSAAQLARQAPQHDVDDEDEDEDEDDDDDHLEFNANITSAAQFSRQAPKHEDEEDFTQASFIPYRVSSPKEVPPDRVDHLEFDANITSAVRFPTANAGIRRVRHASMPPAPTVNLQYLRQQQSQQQQQQQQQQQRPATVLFSPPDQNRPPRGTQGTVLFQRSTSVDSASRVDTRPQAQARTRMSNVQDNGVGNRTTSIGHAYDFNHRPTTSFGNQDVVSPQEMEKRVAEQAALVQRLLEQSMLKQQQQQQQRRASVQPRHMQPQDS